MSGAAARATRWRAIGGRAIGGRGSYGSGMGASARARGRERGFTLMEILIAMVILMVGLVGIMAVFPHAMRQANATVEKSYAAAISQSVVDAIQLGLRELRTPYDDWQMFILDHDGPLDLEADRGAFLRDLNLADLKDAGGQLKPEARTLLRKDYCILMPLPTEVESGGTGRTPIGRAYLFPRKEQSDNEGRVAARRVSIPGGGDKLEVTRVFQLGKALAESEDANLATREIERKDPWSQYGYAFTIRATKGPSADSPTPDRNQQQIVPGLYEVVVSVYRGFVGNPESRYNDPIDRYTAYVTAR